MNFLKGRLLFLVITCLLHISFSECALSQDKIGIAHGPYLIEPSEDAVTVVWFTNKNSTSWVEYSGDQSFGVFPTWGGYPIIAKSNKHGLIDANTKRHAIRITGLEPGKKYRYRIVSKEILKFGPYEVLYGDTVVGDVLEFETLDTNKQSFSFGVVSDIHEKGEKLDSLFQKTTFESLDMMMYTGDILNWIGTEDRIFNGFLDVSVKHFAREKPLIMIRGNHETRGSNARKLFSYFPHSSGKYYYAFTQGEVRFIILDSGEDKADDHPVYAGLVDFDEYRTEQAEWLKKEVQTEEFKKARYTVALFHIPLYTDSNRHGTTDITKKWGPILNDAQIDLVIAGHHHRYSRIEKQQGKNQFPIIILGQDMIMKTDVSQKELSITIRDGKEKLVNKYTIKSKK